jgi:hypothetical protein
MITDEEFRRLAIVELYVSIRKLQAIKLRLILSGTVCFIILDTLARNIMQLNDKEPPELKQGTYTELFDNLLKAPISKLTFTNKEKKS